MPRSGDSSQHIYGEHFTDNAHPNPTPCNHPPPPSAWPASMRMQCGALPFPLPAPAVCNRTSHMRRAFANQPFRSVRLRFPVSARVPLRALAWSGRHRIYNPWLPDSPEVAEPLGFITARPDPVHSGPGWLDHEGHGWHENGGVTHEPDRLACAGRHEAPALR